MGYGPIITELISLPALGSLAAKRPNEKVKAKLEGLYSGEILGSLQITDHEMALACVAGLWLYHDFLDESHRISQDLSSKEGSFWHAILHRREGDFWNSKYWFRELGQHPVYNQIAAEFEPECASAFKKVVGKTFNPCAFVDLCEECTKADSSLEQDCLALQRLEWKKLFDYCFQQATRD